MRRCQSLRGSSLRRTPTLPQAPCVLPHSTSWIMNTDTELSLSDSLGFVVDPSVTPCPSQRGLAVRCQPPFSGTRLPHLLWVWPHLPEAWPEQFLAPSRLGWLPLWPAWASSGLLIFQRPLSCWGCPLMSSRSWLCHGALGGVVPCLHWLNPASVCPQFWWA